MKKSIETLTQTDYQAIIQMAWQQFQSGHSIFSKDGGLAYWTRRTIVLDGEIDAFDWKIESSHEKNPKRR
jgi:hypothetical protein